MERKVQRVGIGEGAFHNPPRGNFNDETKKLIKLLVEEAKVSAKHRRIAENAIKRSHESSQLIPIKEAHDERRNYDDVQIDYPSIRKRSKDAILQSGAYEREQYRRTDPLPNKDFQKRYLANMMAYGKQMPPTPREPALHRKIRAVPPLKEGEDPLKDLVDGIHERIEFLKDMEALGMRKKYEPIIHQELGEKIRIIEAIDKKALSEVTEDLEKYRIERPPPKPFPLGDLDDR